jgi:predicted nuclease with TOPRIM domain
MKIWLILIMSFYTVVVVGGIHYYEEKIKNCNNKVSEAIKALGKQLDINIELDQHNEILKNQIKSLKAENTEFRNAYGKYEGELYRLSQGTPYVNPYGPKFD